MLLFAEPSNPYDVDFATKGCTILLCHATYVALTSQVHYRCMKPYNVICHSVRYSCGRPVRDLRKLTNDVILISHPQLPSLIGSSLCLTISDTRFKCLLQVYLIQTVNPNLNNLVVGWGMPYCRLFHFPPINHYLRGRHPSHQP